MFYNQEHQWRWAHFITTRKVMLWLPNDWPKYTRPLKKRNQTLLRREKNNHQSHGLLQRTNTNTHICEADPGNVTLGCFVCSHLYKSCFAIQRKLMWDSRLHVVNLFYYSWLIKKLYWPMAWQNITRWDIQAEREGIGWSVGERQRQGDARGCWGSKMPEYYW